MTFKSDLRFRRRFFYEFLHVRIVQKAPIHQSHVYGLIKISRTIFENGHPKNIPVILFQNQTSCFREEDFLRISSCTYSARSPHSLEPCFWTDQFSEQFLKRVTKGTFLWNYVKIGPEVPEEKIFKELVKKFHFVAMATRVFDGIKFCEQFFEEDLPRNIPAKFGPNWPGSFGEHV